MEAAAAAAALTTVRAAPAPTHRREPAASPFGGGVYSHSRSHRSWRLRLRALPPELSEILSPKLVPGSPADTGDVSALIPISALMLFFYFVSNWVVPELLMKGMKEQPRPEEDDATPASISAVDGQTDGKIRLKVKKSKKKRKAATKVRASP